MKPLAIPRLAGLLPLLLLVACHDTRPDTPSARPPLIVAHRGGTADAPENTLEAIRLALSHRADALWLSVQLSADGVPLLYRPADLSALTNGAGPVAQLNAAQLAELNAGWQFRDALGNLPYRQHPVGIPTLREALRAIPADITVILDMKALPAEPQAEAVARVLTEEQAWARVTLYSTDAAYQTAFSRYPQARLFESRDVTRQRLLDVLLADRCDNAPDPRAPAAFEWRRDVSVVETFTLGEARSKVAANFWTPATAHCFHRHPTQWLLAIGVNSAADYRAAACLGLDAVLVDSPAALMPAREAWARGDRTCPADVSSTR
ncbi:glycerophosphodiester phosphodiesterase family protein [Dyella telluris]|uniref:Glycerophosphodiester phosphodiesterase n=1 Tax=Dyella telluris TaxID=2763498 RepID=A0A7G8Q6T9_9GAMM|nr:glycerophosphodiester phosphodiesterase family protein [Dyella telluris]QNK02497.1 glycerophosphodiester phosphodiesterase [Dyella telluris]